LQEFRVIDRLNSRVNGLALRGAISASVLASVAGLALAQGGERADAPPAAPASGAASARPTPQQLIEDFVHYTRIARFDLAGASLEEILSANPSNADVVSFVEATDVGRFEDAIQRGLRTQALEGTASRFYRAYEAGKLERARSPEQVAQAITDLTGTFRGRLLAQERLVRAGEYAMPQLLEAFLDGSNPARRAEVRKVMITLGRSAVMPLCAALSKLPATQQESVASVLGQIEWPQSTPFLAELARSSQNDAVRRAATNALQSRGASGIEPALAFRALAEDYYAEKAEITSFPNESHQLLWSYDAGAGLVMTAIRTPVYHEAMAMQLAERSMRLESAGGGTVSPESVALWVASNFSRDIDTPEGYANPSYPVTGAAAPGETPRRGAEFFGVAAGPSVAQMVLSRGLDTKDTPLVRKALASVERTAGVSALSAASGASRLPLAEALVFPNRRVQVESALAIAASAPSVTFVGAERVVPTLAGAVSGLSEQTAAVVAAEPEQYQNVRRLLESAGYKVLPQGRTLSELAASIAESASVELVVGVGVDQARGVELVEQVRGNMRTLATPVFLLARPESAIELSRRYNSGSTVAVRQAAVGDQAITGAIADLVKAASGGPVSASEASAYATRSLSALRDLAVSGNTVLNVGDASAALIAALSEAQGGNKLQIAEILSRVGQDRAQRALAEEVTKVSGGERVLLMAYLADSGKRFGNMLEERQVKRMVELASAADDAEATAGAALIGALGLPSREVVSLILPEAK
jgi:hypothetical protein